jgi:uncharacterized glyoxalase superfamily protein PhnB
LGGSVIGLFAILVKGLEILITNRVSRRPSSGIFSDQFGEEPPAMDIHGVAPLLQVFDMPTAIRFYRDVLGFAVTATSEPGDDCNWAGLKLNGTEVMLNTAYEADKRPSAPDPVRIASHDDTCLFFGCQDLDAAYQDLSAHGVKLDPPKVAPYGMRQLWFHDPDGYGLCFQWPATQNSSDRWVKAYGLEPKTVVQSDTDS